MYAYLAVLGLLFWMLVQHISKRCRLGRALRYETMIFMYKTYALYGRRALQNPFPVDFPKNREELIPRALMRRYNRLVAERIRTGDNTLNMDAMYELIDEILSHCEKTRAPVAATPMPVVQIEDKEAIRDAVRNRTPIVIRGHKWETNRDAVNVNAVIDEYADTTVLFTADNFSVYRDKLSSIRSTHAYIANSTSFLRKHPLVREEDLARLRELSGLQNEQAGMQMFMGLKTGQGTPLHAAFSHNFYFMVQGSKKWTLWHPDYLPFIYPHFSPSGIYMASLTGLRDMDTDDMSEFPLLKYAPRYEIVLEEGDVLWNPGPWWHAIRNVSPVSLAFATRWNDDELIPSTNLCRYMQIANPSVHDLFKSIYTVVGEMRFDVDENLKNEYDPEDLAIIENLNHSTIHKLVADIRMRGSCWHRPGPIDVENCV